MSSLIDTDRDSSASPSIGMDGAFESSPESISSRESEFPPHATGTVQPIDHNGTVIKSKEEFRNYDNSKKQEVSHSGCGSV